MREYSVGNGLRYIWEALLSLAFPPSCSFCDSFEADSPWYLCESCRESITEINPPFCYQCGIPFSGVQREEVWFCGRCQIDAPSYSRVRYAVEYAGSVREGLIQFKYSGKLHLTKTLSRLLIEGFHRHFVPEEFDLILPIPIHRNKLVQRGFNQAVVLAECLAEATEIPLDRTTLRKIKDTRPQVGLPKNERATNLRGSFGVVHRDLVRGKKLLLVDDVSTTGATIREAARVLSSEGASLVNALVLAVRKTDYKPPVQSLLIPHP